MGRKNSEIIQTIKNFKKATQKRYAIDKVILFGSQATGKARESSDIDLLVVSRFRGRKIKLMHNLYHEWHHKQNINYPVDFLCYTPKEFNKMKNMITIVREAVHNGIEI